MQEVRRERESCSLVCQPSIARIKKSEGGFVANRLFE